VKNEDVTPMFSIGKAEPSRKLPKRGSVFTTEFMILPGSSQQWPSIGGKGSRIEEKGTRSKVKGTSKKI